MTTKCDGTITMVEDRLNGMGDGDEEYIIIQRAEGRRVAVVARKSGGEASLTLEVQLRLVSKEPGRELADLSKASSETARLLSRGYAPGEQEEAWVCCEKGLDVQALRDEIEAITGGF